MNQTATDTTNGTNPVTQTGSMAVLGYAASCQKVLAQIAAAREAILVESRQMLAVPERLLRLAMNEAEALAWQTTYPQLVFPELATEKVRAAAHWNATQQIVGRRGPIYAVNT